jgi:uncharacterized protein YqcC (DUF446 family)
MNASGNHYAKATALAEAIESELKRLNRWTADDLPDEAFVNMGAFGSNTMAFEQWLQFVLLPRIRGIVKDKGEFPDGSMIGTYAMRVFDGDPQAHALHNLLYGLDSLVNEINSPEEILEPTSIAGTPPSERDVITLGSENLPHVVYSLVEVLHEFEGDDLESQLQTFDTFLDLCSPKVRPELSALLLKASDRMSNPDSVRRIEEAAKSVLNGGRVAPPHNHEEHMRKYREQFRKDFPDPD